MKTCRGPVGIALRQTHPMGWEHLGLFLKLGLVLGVFLGPGGGLGYWPRWTRLSLSNLTHHGHSAASCMEEIRTHSSGAPAVGLWPFPGHFRRQDCASSWGSVGEGCGMGRGGGTTGAKACYSWAGRFLSLGMPRVDVHGPVRIWVLAGGTLK